MTRDESYASSIEIDFEFLILVSVEQCLSLCMAQLFVMPLFALRAERFVHCVEQQAHTYAFRFVHLSFEISDGAMVILQVKVFVVDLLTQLIELPLESNVFVVRYFLNVEMSDER